MKGRGGANWVKGRGLYAKLGEQCKVVFLERRLERFRLVVYMYAVEGKKK